MATLKEILGRLVSISTNYFIKPLYSETVQDFYQDFARVFGITRGYSPTLVNTSTVVRGSSTKTYKFTTEKYKYNTGETFGGTYIEPVYYDGKFYEFRSDGTVWTQELTGANTAIATDVTSSITGTIPTGTYEFYGSVMKGTTAIALMMDSGVAYLYVLELTTMVGSRIDLSAEAYWSGKTYGYDAGIDFTNAILRIATDATMSESYIFVAQKQTGMTQAPYTGMSDPVLILGFDITTPATPTLSFATAFEDDLPNNIETATAFAEFHHITTGASVEVSGSYLYNVLVMSGGTNKKRAFWVNLDDPDHAPYPWGCRINISNVAAYKNIDWRDYSGDRYFEVQSIRYVRNNNQYCWVVGNFGTSNSYTGSAIVNNANEFLLNYANDQAYMTINYHIAGSGFTSLENIEDAWYRTWGRFVADNAISLNWMWPIPGGGSNHMLLDNSEGRISYSSSHYRGAVERTLDQTAVTKYIPAEDVYVSRTSNDYAIHQFNSKYEVYYYSYQGLTLDSYGRIINTLGKSESSSYGAITFLDEVPQWGQIIRDMLRSYIPNFNKGFFNQGGIRLGGQLGATKFNEGSMQLPKVSTEKYEVTVQTPDYSIGTRYGGYPNLPTANWVEFEGTAAIWCDLDGTSFIGCNFWCYDPITGDGGEDLVRLGGGVDSDNPIGYAKQWLWFEDYADVTSAGAGQKHLTKYTYSDINGGALSGGSLTGDSIPHQAPVGSELRHFQAVWRFDDEVHLIYLQNNVAAGNGYNGIWKVNKTTEVSTWIPIPEFDEAFDKDSSDVGLLYYLLDEPRYSNKYFVARFRANPAKTSLMSNSNEEYHRILFIYKPDGTYYFLETTKSTYVDTYFTITDSYLSIYCDWFGRGPDDEDLNFSPLIVINLDELDGDSGTLYDLWDDVYPGTNWNFLRHPTTNTALQKNNLAGLVYSDFDLDNVSNFAYVPKHDCFVILNDTLYITFLYMKDGGVNIKERYDLDYTLPTYNRFMVYDDVTDKIWIVGGDNSNNADPPTLKSIDMSDRSVTDHTASLFDDNGTVGGKPARMFISNGRLFISHESYPVDASGLTGGYHTAFNIIELPAVRGEVAKRSSLDNGQVLIENAENSDFTDDSALPLSQLKTSSLIIGQGTLVDGASISWDLDSRATNIYRLETAQSTIALTISNPLIPSINHLNVVKTIAGDCVITISGAGLRFVDLDNKALPATSVNITLSDTADFDFEISLLATGRVYSGDDVINVKMV